MIKEVIKVKSEKTYKNEKGKECHYYNYYLVLANDKWIQIRPSFGKDSAVLDAICTKVK